MSKSVGANSQVHHAFFVKLLHGSRYDQESTNALSCCRSECAFQIRVGTA